MDDQRLLILGIWTILSSAVYSSSASQFIVTHAPQYVHFDPAASDLPLSEIPPLLQSTYGLSVQDQALSWTGLRSDSLFHRPKANVMFSVSGLGEVQTKVKLPTVAAYNTYVDSDGVETETVTNSLLSSSKAPLVLDFSTKTIFNVQADHPQVFGQISRTLEEIRREISADRSLSRYSLGSLNASRDDDVTLLAEVHLVHALIDALKASPALVRDSSPDFYHFRLSGLKAIMHTHGASSQQTTDAAALVQDFIQEMTNELRALYKDNVIIQVVMLPTSPPAQSVLKRKTRSLLQDDGDQPSVLDIGLASAVDPQFAVIFNIMLWMSILIAVSVLAVSVCIWNMDPGRDSIIYRMTSQRIKKD